MARANNLRVLVATVAVVFAACLLVLARPAMAVITPTNNAASIAGALTSDPAFLSGASFDSVTGGTPNAVSDSALSSFPTNGADYGILTSGDANFADDPNDSPGTTADNGGGNVRGNTDRDVSILKVDLDVPSSANCLSVDFQFLSEEHPEFVGTSFNDAFIAELDTSSWTTSGSVISAPNNFAFDPSGDVISINSSGVANMTAANSAGTTYDAGTQLLAAKTPITPGAHSLYISIFDQGDNILDSAVFLDNLDLYSSSVANCQKGVEPPGPTADAGGPYTVDEGESVDLDGSLSSDPENGALTYAWDLDNDGQYDDSTDVSPSFSAADLDGPSSHTVKVEVTNPAGKTDTDDATVNVDNVEPTIQSISSSHSQTLTGTSVSFDAQTTDPSNADTNAGFTYAWSVDGVANSFTGNPLDHSFSGCGEHSVSATATDKDGGVSASVTSDVVSVSEAHFHPPLDEGVYNTVQKGRVVPVKISIGCEGQNLSGLNPAIQLLKGDKTAGGESASDAIETFSSSAADTTGLMRAVDGGYIYNLQVPSNAVAGELFTIRVRPFGDSNTSDMRVVLKIRK
jgi:PKD domain